MVAMEEAVEITVTTIKKCFAFKIPTRTSSGGYKAADWNKEAIWTGRLRVVEKGGFISVLLEDTEKEGLYVRCDISNEENVVSVEPVSDSSRYFVLRLEAPGSKGRILFMGIGFQSREEAFDFKVALRELERQRQAIEDLAKASKQDSVDLKLEDGAMLKLKSLKIDGKSKPKSRAQVPTEATALADFSIAAPPPGKRKKKKSKKHPKGAGADDLLVL